MVVRPQKRKKSCPLLAVFPRTWHPIDMGKTRSSKNRQAHVAAAVTDLEFDEQHPRDTEGRFIETEAPEQLVAEGPLSVMLGGVIGDETPMVEAQIGDNNLLLEKVEDEWRFVDPMTEMSMGFDFNKLTAIGDSEQAAEAYQKTVEFALVGNAVAEAVNAGMVKPDAESLAALTSHISAMQEGETSDATIDGVDSIAFEAVGFWTLNQVADDMRQRWDNATEDGPAPSRLLSAEMVENDPLRDPDAVGYVDTCTDKALRAVGAGKQVFMEYLPIERIVCDTITNSPVTAAEKTGLGSAVGGDPGVFADLYEAHMAAGTGAYPQGMIILSKAHRADPESDEFRAWVREHIKIGEDENRETALAEAKPWSIGGVLDAAVYGEPDTELAVRAMKVLAEEAPEEFRSGIQEFYAWGLETEEEMLAPFKDDPEMSQLVDKLMADYREMVSECEDLEELLAQT